MGNASLLTESGINFTPRPWKASPRRKAADGQFIGTIAIADRIKTDAAQPSTGFAAWG